MLPVVLLIVLMRLPVGLGRPNCSGLLSVAAPSLPDQTRSQLFGALVVAIDVLVFVSFLPAFFDAVFYLLSGPLGVDFDLPR